jgi:biopolymer transport protein ExbD
MITIDKDAQVFLDGAPTDNAALLIKMKEAVSKDKEVRAVVSADQSLNYGKVMKVIDLVKEAGIAKFALNIVKDGAAAGP